MRWKAVGVWLVVIFVGLVVYSSGRTKYKVAVKGIPKEDPSNHKYLVLVLIFGACSICCQIIACCIMLSATMSMDKMRKKNNFDNSQFEDIKMNLIVSLFVCVGYSYDFTSDLTMCLLMMEGVMGYELEHYIIEINRIVLTVCLFVAYIILLKIFMTYQNQIDEAHDNRKAKKDRRLAKLA